MGEVLSRARPSIQTQWNIDLKTAKHFVYTKTQPLNLSALMVRAKSYPSFVSEKFKKILSSLNPQRHTDYMTSIVTSFQKKTKMIMKFSFVFAYIANK